MKISVNITRQPKKNKSELQDHLKKTNAYKNLKTVTVPFKDLITLITSPKYSGIWSPFIFNQTRSKENNITKELHFITYDFDNDWKLKFKTSEECINYIETYLREYIKGQIIFIPSPSFSEQDKVYKYRIIIPLQHPIKIDDYPKTLNIIDGMYLFDPQVSQDTSRVFYFMNPNNHKATTRGEGKSDLTNLPNQTPRPPRPKRNITIIDQTPKPTSLMFSLQDNITFLKTKPTFISILTGITKGKRLKNTYRLIKYLQTVIKDKPRSEALFKHFTKDIQLDKNPEEDAKRRTQRFFDSAWDS